MQSHEDYGQVCEKVDAQIETFNELLSAHKELIELMVEHSDRFAFLN